MSRPMKRFTPAQWMVGVCHTAPLFFQGVGIYTKG